MELKKFAACLLAALLMLTITAAAADDDEESTNGFTEVGGVTNSKNEYFFEVYESVLVDNNESTQDIDFDEIYAGSSLYIPIHVFADRGTDSAPATDKQLKTDDVSVSSKVMTGKAYVGNIEVVDGKKIKLDGVEAAPYVKIPFATSYEGTSKTSIRINMVLSVNGITYQDSQIVLKCFLRGRVTEIEKNTVYGAKSPTRYQVRKNYSGEVTFEFVDKVKYTARVKGGGSYYLNLSREEDESVRKIYPDAALEFYDFKGSEDKFQTKGRLEIPVDRANLGGDDDDPSLYVYRIDGGNTLTALSTGVVSYDDNKDVLTIHTQTLDNYVLSDTPLKREIDKTTTDILKSGYASAETNQNSAADASGASQTSQTGTQPASSAAQSASSTAQPGASAASDAIPDSYPYDGDGYTPEEGSYYNDNLNMGLPINADNRSADNPNTAEPPPLLPAAVAMSVTAAATLVFFKKNPRIK